MKRRKELSSNWLREGKAQLMQGVTEILTALEHAALPRCVVTHSPLSLIHLIREQNPVLNTIPHWITRENYSHPKPHAECYPILPYDPAVLYHDAVTSLDLKTTPRGLKALQGTKAQPVLICPRTIPI